MPTNILHSTDIAVPGQIVDAILGKVKFGSALAQLSQNVPQKYGAGQAWTADIGEAELVTPGAQKSPSSLTPNIVALTPHKFQKTIRLDQEVQWADEDYQLSILAQLQELIGPALARALDYGGIHGIDPLSGAAAASIIASSKIASTTSAVTATSNPVTDLDAAEALVVAAGYVPNGIALDPALAASFRGQRDTNGKRIYPEFKLSTEKTDLDGFAASVSKTVGAVGVASVATNLKGIVGDFNQFVWGIQKDIGVEVITTGDPDGQGDLKRQNQIAIRAEIVYGWGIADLSAFAKITS
ncbi:MAG: phage major capsid protein [Propionibacteriaceae bacterium]|jgi:hypothetical protein|nr:phage major capsid protein [Propionibacteriaceae bacterium]